MTSTTPTSTTQGYYERYWADPAAAPPADDPTTPERRRRLKAALADLPAGARVLDLGCGTGEFTECLAGLGYDATGIDLSGNAIAVARQRFPQRRFLQGLPEDHGAAFAGRFDAAWSTEVIEHVFDVYGFLAAAHRALVPGGRLVMTTPYHGLLKNWLIDLRGYATHYNPFGGHIRFFDRRSLDRCRRHCGFTPRRWDGFGRPWPLYKSFFVVAERTHEVSPPPPADS